MKALILFVGWCILFVFCWPIALLALILFLLFCFCLYRCASWASRCRLCSHCLAQYCFCPLVCWDGRGMSVMQSPPSPAALQRTAVAHCSCHRRASCSPSLSLDVRCPKRLQHFHPCPRHR